MVFGIGDGRLELTLDKSTYTPGDIIKGRARLILNKPVDARELRVELYREDSDSEGTRKHLLQKTQIAGARTYYNQEEHKFELQIPTATIPQLPDGLLGNIVKWALEKTKHNLFVHVSLDMPRKFDINKRVPISLTKPIIGTSNSAKGATWAGKTF